MMNHKTKWEALREILNSIKPSVIISRKQIMQIMRDSYGFTCQQSYSTFDCYRRSLELNGFIENVSNSLGKPGFYMKLYDIPEDLSSTECTKRAYNNPICRNKTSIFEEII